MATITTRSQKGSPLTNNEVDANFTNLNTDKAELSGAAFTGAITTNSTFDGRDVATDGTKLDGIESGATADQTAAQIKTAYESNSDTNAFTDADHSKLDGIEASADVTDTANVTAAGALMDSELTSIASVKALNQGVATTDSPTFVGLNATGDLTLDVAGDIILDADGGDIILKDGGTHFGSFTRTNNDLIISHPTSDEDILIQGNDGGTTVTAVKFDMSDGGTAEFGSAIVLGGSIVKTGDMTLDASGDIILDADGGNVKLLDGGVVNLDIYKYNSNVYIENPTSNSDIIFSGSDGGSPISALTLDMSAAGAATFNAGATFNGTATMDLLTVDTSSVGGFKVTNEATSGVRLTAYQGTTNSNVRTAYVDSQEFVVSTGAPTGTTVTERFRIDSSGNVGIGTSSPVAPLHVKGTTNGNLLVRGGSLAVSGLTGTALTSVNDAVSATTPLTLEGSEFNFVQSNAVKVKVDSAGNVGIGTSSPSTKLQIQGDGVTLKLDGTANTSRQINLRNTGTAEGQIQTDGNMHFIQEDANRYMRFSTANTERMRIDSSGNVGIGTSSPSNKLEIRNDVSASVDLDPTAIKLYNNSDGGSAIEFSNGVGAKSKISLGVKTTGAGTDDSYLGFSTGANTALSERMRIDSSGNVGIGGTPTSPLHVFGGGILGASSTNPIAFTGSSDDNAGIGSYNANTDFNVYSAGAGNIKFRTGNTWNSAGQLTAIGPERMRIDSSGNVLVGVTSISDATSRTYGNAFSGSGSNGNWTSWGSGAHTHAIFRNGTGIVGTITTTASATTYNTSSDQRLKENITDADDAGSKIDAIQVRQYDWKADGSHQDYGMIAQELQTVAPEAVSGDADSEEMMGVDYSKLVPMLIKEIQSLRNRVAQLEE